MKIALAGIAFAGMLLVAAPAEQAHAVSLINPAGAALARDAVDDLKIEVRRGGGGPGFRGGGMRMGRAHFGGPRHFGGRHFGFRRHHWRGPRVYWGGPVYFGGPIITYPRRCRWVRTYAGPRRVCRIRRVWW